jgi:hypothetical protein
MTRRLKRLSIRHYGQTDDISQLHSTSVWHGSPSGDYSPAMKRRRSPRPFVVVLALLGSCAHRTASVAPTAATPVDLLDAAAARELKNINRMFDAVAAVRGLPLTSRPRLEPLDDDVFVAACVDYQAALAAEQVGPELAKSPEEMEGNRQSCRHTSAYYDPHRDLLVLRRTLERKPAGERAEVLSHELEHLLVAHALPPLPPPHGWDGGAAQRALGEGDAVVTSAAYLLSLDGRRLADYVQRLVWMYERHEEKSTRDYTYFFYALGARFVAQLFAHGGFRAVDDAFRRPPTSTTEILHVDRYLAHEPRPTIATSLPLPPGFVVRFSGPSGELRVRQLLARCVSPLSAIAIADDYAADDLTESKPTPKGDRMSRWIIVWRSEVAAMTFARTASTCKGIHMQVAQEDALSVLVTGLDDDAARSYAAAVLADVRRAAREATIPPRP